MISVTLIDEQTAKTCTCKSDGGCRCNPCNCKDCNCWS